MRRSIAYWWAFIILSNSLAMEQSAFEIIFFSIPMIPRKVLSANSFFNHIFEFSLVLNLSLTDNKFLTKLSKS